MIKNKLIFAIAFLLLISLTSASDIKTFRAGMDIPLELPLKEGDLSQCTTCSCTGTINYPNGTIIIRNQDFPVVDGYATYNLGGGNTSEIYGLYNIDVNCNNGVDYGSATYYFEVTATGTNMSTSQSIIYVILFVLGIILFSLSFYGAIKIPFYNTVSGDEETISINDLKYVKIFLWFVSYLLLIWIAFVSWNLSYGFLVFNIMSEMFKVIFYFLLVLLLPIFITLIIISFINYFNDKKIRYALERGMPTGYE